MDKPQGTLFLINHPSYDSFAVVCVYGTPPTMFPKQLECLMPGNYKGDLAGVEISNNHSYLEYLKAEWTEGFEGYERRPMLSAEGVDYRVVTRCTMI